MWATLHTTKEKSLAVTSKHHRNTNGLPVFFFFWSPCSSVAWWIVWLQNPEHPRREKGKSDPIPKVRHKEGGGLLKRVPARHSRKSSAEGSAAGSLPQCGLRWAVRRSFSASGSLWDPVLLPFSCLGGSSFEMVMDIPWGIYVCSYTFLQGLCMLLSSVERLKGGETVTMWFSSICTLFTVQIPASAPQLNERRQKKQYWWPYPPRLIPVCLCFPADLLPSQHQTVVQAGLNGHTHWLLHVCSNSRASRQQQGCLLSP